MYKHFLDKHQAWLLWIVIATTYNFMLCSSASAQRSCENHSEDWHQHPWDGYWLAWWRIVDWEGPVVFRDDESDLGDEWLRLLEAEHSNEDCETANLDITWERDFTHSVTIDWGGGLAGNLEGAAQLLFQKAKASVGASRMEEERTVY